MFVHLYVKRLVNFQSIPISLHITDLTLTNYTVYYFFVTKRLVKMINNCVFLFQRWSAPTLKYISTKTY